MNRREQNRLREQQQAAEAAARAAQQTTAPTTEPTTTEPVATTEVPCGDEACIAIGLCVCSEVTAKAKVEAQAAIARAQVPETSTPKPSPAAVDPAVPAAKAEPVQSRPEVCDFVTVVECHPSRRLAKTWQADGEIRGCDEALNFNVYERPLKSFNGLVNLLDTLATHSHRAIIRGKWSGDSLPDLVVPKKMSREGVKRSLQTFHDEPHHWVLFDVDEFRPTAGHPVLDPEPAIEEFIQTKLPPEFHNRSYRWNLTGSAGHPKNEGVLKLRLAWWLKTPYDSTALAAWQTAKGIEVDDSLFRPIQYHYTSNPHFDPGVEDPVPLRSGVVQKAADEVDLVISETLLAQRKERKPRGGTPGEPRLADPTKKKGVIGAFCRLYPPARLLEEFGDTVPFEYQYPEGGTRLNFLHGSRAEGGAYITDCGNYIGNVHSSDPFNKRPANSFDLVRCYKFGHLDDDDGFDDDPTCSTSYHRAIEYAKTLPDVQAELAAEREEQASEDRGASTGAYDAWSKQVEDITDGMDLYPLMAQLKVDGSVVEYHRALLGDAIHRKFKKLSSDGRTSPETLAQIKKTLKPPPVAVSADSRGLWMLDKLALIRVGGKVAVLDIDESQNPKGLDAIVTMGVNDARTFYRNHKVFRPHPETGNPVPCDMFDAWLDHNETKRYRGVEFEPDGGRDGYYNIWQEGFATKPVPGDCSLYLAHIQDVICAGDAAAFDWVMNWLADVVQNPGRKPGTALVLRGGQGAGKGKAFADPLSRIFGPKIFLKVSKMHELTSNFNKHLVGKVMIFANESVWGGDRSKEGALKDLITEDVQLIEPKGLDRFSVSDYARVLFATNEAWAVPAGPDSRRYTVLDVSNHRIPDNLYFQRIYDELDNGGREAFMHLLATRDLTGFVVFHALKTEALLDLKMMHLDTADKWLFEYLADAVGDKPDSDYDGFDAGTWWPVSWTIKQAHDNYCEFARKHGERHIMDSARFGIWLRKRLPGLRKIRPAGKAREYVFPDLATCRAAFDTFIGHKVAWDEDDPED